ncbi:MAG: hypothetical protein R3F59_00985 [Myxococcota bacterium]
MAGAGGDADERAVFASLDGSRWFHLPPSLAGVAQDEGGLQVRGMLGQLRRLDPQMVAAYEVTEAQGKELARAELLGLLGSASRGLQAVGGLLASQGKDPAALAPVHKVVDAVSDALRQPSDPPPAARAPVTGAELQARFEAWVKRATDDPRELDRLRQVASDLQGAAEQLKAASPRRK